MRIDNPSGGGAEADTLATVTGRGASTTTASTFQGNVTVGKSGGSAGQVSFVGSTSGTVGIKVAAAAGTWDLTLPTTDGNASEFLQTNGSGVCTWAAPAASVEAPSLIVTNATGGDIVNIIKLESNSTVSASAGIYTKVTNNTTNNANGAVRVSIPQGSFGLWSYKVLGTALAEFAGAGTGCEYVLWGGNGPLEYDITSGQNHMGFAVKAVAGTLNLYAISGNGTQTQTDLGTYAGERNFYGVLWTPATSVKFYVNGSLVATHTTNLPTGEMNDIHLFGARNKNDDATGRSATVYAITSKVIIA